MHVVKLNRDGILGRTDDDQRAEVGFVLDCPDTGTLADCFLRFSSADKYNI